MQRKDTSNLMDFTRGAELWVHQFRMFITGVGNLIIVGLLLMATFVGAYIFFKVTPTERYAMGVNMEASFRTFVGTPNKEIMVWIDGKEASVTLEDAIKLTEHYSNSGWRDVKNAFILGFLFTIMLIGFLIYYWRQFGRSVMLDEKLRGASLVTGDDLKSLVEHNNEAGEYTIAGVPMKAGSEVTNILFAGAPGAGKSQSLFDLMTQIRAKKRKAIVYDPSQEFMQIFYREGKDIIMNPLDARSPNWNVWNEVKQDYHYDNIASALIPSKKIGDTFFEEASQRLTADIMRVLGESNLRTNKALYDTVTKSTLPQLHALLKGTGGATFVDPKTEKTAQNILMTMMNKMEPFRYMHDEGEQFSIRDWVSKPDEDSWMFITTRESERGALKPILSLMINIVIKAVTDLPAVHKERLWLLIDELPTLERLDDLIYSLTNTRKFGLCHAIGIQDFAQMNEIYGKDNANTIISSLQTKHLMRVNDGDSAKRMSELLGSMEVEEKNMSRSMGANSGRDGDSFFSHRKDRAIVLPSEITTLPNLHGYLMIPGNYPVAKVQHPYVEYPKLVENFIARNKFDFTLQPIGTLESPALGSNSDLDNVTPREIETPNNTRADFDFILNPLNTGANKPSIDKPASKLDDIFE